MQALDLLLDESLAYGDALQQLVAAGWPAGGAAAPAGAVARARDVPEVLRAWWLAPEGPGAMKGVHRGLPLVIGPDRWVSHFAQDRVLASPDDGIGAWRLERDGLVRWVHPLSIAPEVELRPWLAARWVMESIQGALEHRFAILDDEVLERALAVLEPLPMLPWPWPASPTRFYAAPDLLVFVAPAPEGGWELRGGARAEEVAAWSVLADLPLEDA